MDTQSVVHVGERLANLDQNQGKKERRGVMMMKKNLSQ